jgi:N-methylhydantoinase A
MSNSYYLGIDIGGTFTDIVVFEERSKRVKILKLSSTPDEPERAVIEALKSIDINLDEIKIINHASTIATNALLTRTGLAKVALVTNNGFRDVLEIARQRRSEIYDLRFSRPIPLVPRKFRYTISGRIDSEGRELERMNPDELKKIAGSIKEEGIESVAISLLNSYVNQDHEIAVGKFFRNLGERVFLSSEINPEFREYERTSTTVVNAALAPLISKYLGKLKDELGAMKIKAEFYIMGSNGGLNTSDYATRLPISIIESGPSAGVLASSYMSKRLGLKRVITFDMGGTTAKAGTILDGRPDISSEFEAAGKTHSGRSIKGSGYSVRFPFIDLAEVSAGGGTIAWIDEGDSLRVGPRSAGAHPGPAAYRKGGEEPTITDANIILGRLNPDYLLGGKMKIYKELAEKAIKERIADPLGLDVVEAADGITKMINNAMAKAISIVSVERGRDPRDFSMMAFGGAGPIHSCDLAENNGIGEIIVPKNPGLFSAYGLLTVDIVRPFSRTILGLSPREIKSVFASLKNEAEESLAKEGIKRVRTEMMVDVHYVGQSYEISVPYSEGKDPISEFRAQHRKLYGYDSDDPVEMINARVVARAAVPKIGLEEGSASGKGIEKKRRKVYFNDRFLESDVIVRESLPPGTRGKGPVIIEGYDSTVVVNPGWHWSIDRYLNAVLRRD